MSSLMVTLPAVFPTLESQFDALRQAPSLRRLILLAWHLGLQIAVLIVQEILQERGQADSAPHICPQCQTRLHSKGLLPRQVTTVLGIIRWKRRVLRCPHQCAIGQIAPLDTALGPIPVNEFSAHVMSMVSWQFCAEFTCGWLPEARLVHF